MRGSLAARPLDPFQHSAMTACSRAGRSCGSAGPGSSMTASVERG